MERSLFELTGLPDEARAEFHSLSPKSQMLLARGVRGAEDPPADATPAEGDAPAEVPAEVETPAEGAAPESTEEAAASIDVPVLDLSGDEAVLREQHAAYEALIAEHRPTANTQTQYASLRLARDHANAIVAEISRRRGEQAAIVEGLAALDAEEVPALPADAPVLASVAAIVRDRPGQPPAVQAPVATAPRPKAALLAAAGSQVAGDGETVNLAALGMGIDRAKRGKGSGVTRLASIGAYEDSPDGLPEMLTKDNSVSTNDRLIREAVEDWRNERTGAEHGARTAAICEPFDTIRDIPSEFSTVEVVSAIWPQRPAGRLGYQFTRSMALNDMGGGSTIWTEADQAAVDPTDPSTWKPCVEVDCGDPVPVSAEAVTACLSFPITLEMSSPERLANATAALNAVRARNKEGRILAIADSLSSAYNFTGQYGALPALIEALNTVLAQAVFSERLDSPMYTLVLDVATARLLTIDRANRAYGVESEVSDVLAYVLGNVDGIDRIVTALDPSSDGEPGVPFLPINPVGDAADDLPVLNGEHRIRLYEPSSAIYAETGELNVGIARSPEMMRQNRAQYFSEEFFMLEKHGPAPWFTIDVDLCNDGARAGLLEPTRCALS